MIYQYDTTYNPKNFQIFSEMFTTGTIGVGDYQNLLRERLKEITGCKYVFLTNSGTSALYIALRSIDISETREVVIPSYLCQEVLNAIRYTGASPSFVDINSFNYSMDLQQTKKSISTKTGAIIVPYMHGDAFSIEVLKDLGVPIIEDIAHCTGCTLNGNKVGSFGTVGITSFGDRKYLDGGFGGALFTNNSDLAHKIQSLLTLNMEGKYNINYNYNIPNIIASIIYEKSFLINEYSKSRRKIAEYYIEHFKNKNVEIRYNSILDSFFYRFMLDIPIDKKQFIKNMKSRGVICGVGVDYPLNVIMGKEEPNLPNTDFASKKSIALPIRPNLMKYEMDKIIDAVSECI